MSEQRQPSLTMVEDFEEFFRHATDKVYRALALATGDRDLAEEAAAEAMARAFQHWSKVSTYDSPTGWAYRVGLNWATSRLRRLKFKSPKPVPETPVLDAEPMDPSLARSVSQLKVQFREVLVMRYFLDLDQHTIARTLDIPVGTVKSRIARALEALRKEMDI